MENNKDSENQVKAIITAQPVGRSYNFLIGSWKMRIELSPFRNELGIHPLDILQSDLERILLIVSRAERFSGELGKRYTLEDVMGIEKDDKAQ